MVRQKILKALQYMGYIYAIWGWITTFRDTIEQCEKLFGKDLAEASFLVKKFIIGYLIQLQISSEEAKFTHIITKNKMKRLKTWLTSRLEPKKNLYFSFQT